MPRLSAIALAAVATLLALPAARAMPPTVMPSPGYDARLQESRKAMSPSAQPQLQPAPRPHPHRKKKR